ncbi:MAG TPA: NADP-dependent oxidoreductase, partial [Bacillota bacterium]|nr:NADP-dependent oxidoreductase [Bacillota bacterium]
MTAMTMTATMKAVRIHAFGGPEVLAYEEVPRPEPAIDQILVRVHAAGVNPVDWKIRQGLLGASPLPQTMGSDFSGMVEAVSPEVHEFHVGDLVFGVVAEESGSYAEYTVAPVSRVARKPEGLDEVHAAALPIASLTAWQALFDAARLRAGQKVLIHAAAGGVGSFAVQFAHWKGAQVIGTASARNQDYVRGLGVDQFIDYHATRFEEVVQGADVVLDTV